MRRISVGWDVGVMFLKAEMKRRFNDIANTTKQGAE